MCLCVPNTSYTQSLLPPLYTILNNKQVEGKHTFFPPQLSASILQPYYYHYHAIGYPVIVMIIIISMWIWHNKIVKRSLVEDGWVFYRFLFFLFRYIMFRQHFAHTTTVKACKAMPVHTHTNHIHYCSTYNILVEGCSHAFYNNNSLHRCFLWFFSLVCVCRLCAQLSNVGRYSHWSF